MFRLRRRGGRVHPGGERLLGIVERLAGGTAYLDANVFIYAIERVPEFARLLADLLPAIDRGEIAAVTSELTLAEVLARPLKEGNEPLVADYLAAVRTRRTLTVVPVSREIIVSAARLRGEARLKLPDAIHAATALAIPCRSFVTNDPRFAALTGIETMVLSQMPRG